MSIAKKNIKKERIFQNKGRIAAVRPIHVAEDLSWNYGTDVIVYDVRKKTPYVSYYIVASAQNDESLYDNFYDLDHKEGRNDSNWILLDAKQVVVQLFTEEMRKEVDFDALYEDCPHVIVEAKTEPKYRKRARPASQRK